MKECTKCKIFKPLDEFSKDNRNKIHGRQYWCKLCAKSYSKQPLMAERLAQYRKEYKQNNKQKFRDSATKARKKFPEKCKARHLVDYALRTGTLVRPETCSHCCSECTPHAHHKDYTQPLMVLWLCRKCHIAMHEEVLVC